MPAARNCMSRKFGGDTPPWEMAGRCSLTGSAENLSEAALMTVVKQPEMGAPGFPTGRTPGNGRTASQDPRSDVFLGDSSKELLTRLDGSTDHAEGRQIGYVA
jgi:hypothetical protein